MNKSISDIKNEFDLCSIEQLQKLIEVYSSDERKGVINICKKNRIKLDKYKGELQRIYNLQEYERKYSEYEFVAGVDEVGRGPLAGPVVAGVVILPKNCNILYINDSKKLSEKVREELYEVITNEAVAYATGVVSPQRIDEINILNATYEAMRIAISNLKVKPDILLNDAVTIPGVDIKQVPIIKGDAKSINIGAASIIAKVTRDRMMVAYDEIYPEYNFSGNKGYGSAQHIEALKKYGKCPIHRDTFIHNFLI